MGGIFLIVLAVASAMVLGAALRRFPVL